MAIRYLRLLALALLPLSSSALAALPTGKPAPALSAPLLTTASASAERVFDLTRLRGKVVYVDFWATWCAPCRVSLPLLEGLRRELGPAGFEVLGVNVETDTEVVRRVIARQGLSYPVLHPVADTVMQRWQVNDMPTAYLIDRKGQVRRHHAGFRSADLPALRAEIEQLLKESAR